MTWEKVKLGDIASNIQTGPFGSQLHQSDYSEFGTPVVMPKDLTGGKISEKSIARVSEDHVNRLSRHIINSGDILYSRRGDVGRCAFATEFEKGWLCGTGCLRVTINLSEANPKFIFYQLQQPDVIGWVENHAVGSTMLNLNTTILSNIPLVLPKLEIQNKISDILSAYDDLIENNQKQIKLLEEAVQRLYKEWFVDLRFPGYESTPIIDGVPEGWEKTDLGKIGCRLESGSRPKGGIDSTIKNGIPSVGAENVIGLGKYNFSAEKLISKEYYSKMKKGKLKDKDIFHKRRAQIHVLFYYILFFLYNLCKKTEMLVYIICNNGCNLLFHFHKLFLQFIEHFVLLIHRHKLIVIAFTLQILTVSIVHFSGFIN